MPTPPFDADALPLERVASLNGLGVVAGFVGRVAGVDVVADRTAALARLEDTHRAARQVMGLKQRVFATAGQVHGRELALLVDAETLPTFPITGADGLVTNRRDVCLGIYVADCSAVFLVDPVRKAIGLVHSGRKGTELGIIPAAIDAMQKIFGTEAGDLVVGISPSIRPPWYEVDFAAEIVRQCQAAGVRRVHDEGLNTAEHPDRYYSYRREKGRTGRMLALLALA